jgi:hypothetical protein
MRLGVAILLALAAGAALLTILPWTQTAAMVLLTASAIAVARYGRVRLRWHWLDLLLPIVTGLYVRYATHPSLWAWENWRPSRRDFFFIWGTHARLFLAAHSVDFHFLQQTPNDLSHPDYPWLWPLIIDWVMLLRGRWDPMLVGIISALFGAALLLILRELLAAEIGDPRVASLATLAAAGIAFPMSVGFAEAPFIAYSASGVLLIRNRHTRLGALLLGLAAVTKNEGLALIVAVAIALLIARRSVLPMWPAVAVTLPWLIVRAFLGVPTDLFAGNLAQRLTAHLQDPAHLFAGFTGIVTEQPWFFLALSLTLLAGIRNLRRETFVILTVVLQLAFYVAAYLISPLDTAGHVVSSWGRLTGQLAIPLLFVAISAQFGSAADGEARQ